jgi:flagellin-like hook-associated protein FlgL
MPANNITLSSSIRQNLLSLQNTTKLLDLTSNRLSTGLKVNSSLDDPAAFFAARSLTARAGDLNQRKDGIGQAVSLLQSTDKSLTAVTSLVEQAKAKATEADEAATAGVNTLSSKKAVSITGTTTLSTAFSAATAVGNSLVAVGNADNSDTLVATVNGQASTFTIANNSTVASLVTFLDSLNSVSAVFNATTKQIDITADNGGSEVKLADGIGASFFGASELSANGLFSKDSTTIVADAATVTFGTENKDTDILTATFGFADDNTIITTVTDGGANTFTAEAGNDGVASTIADLVTSVGAADTGLTVTYNTTTSKVDIKAAEGVAVDFSGTGFSALLLDDGTNTLTSGVDATFTKFGTATQVAALTVDFRTLLEQINGLISDASYKGTNLLKASETLDVKFNATGDEKLTITGKSLENDSNGVLTGLKFTQQASDYDFETAGDITSALADVDKAITELRTIASTFGTSLGVIQTREDFTIELVNALETGAAKLVNANLEEESAKLLALQTRQAIGVQSLAIANTSQQSILALFR